MYGRGGEPERRDPWSGVLRGLSTVLFVLALLLLVDGAPVLGGLLLAVAVVLIAVAAVRLARRG